LLSSDKGKTVFTDDVISAVYTFRIHTTYVFIITWCQFQRVI